MSVTQWEVHWTDSNDETQTRSFDDRHEAIRWAEQCRNATVYKCELGTGRKSLIWV